MKEQRLSIRVFDLGAAPYTSVWDLQRSIQELIIQEKRAIRNGNGAGTSSRTPDTLLFVEHPHVYTLGKSGKDEHMLRSLLELQELHAEFIRTDRGGDITYHGPGQIVAYPILDLDRHFTDVAKYLRYLEEVVIRVCGHYGLAAQRQQGLTGVWIGEAKICAFGIRCAHWVTMHGLALNVNTDLRYFNNIVPCGIANKSVTSLEKELGRKVDVEEVKEILMHHFAAVFKVMLKHHHKKELDYFIL